MRQLLSDHQLDDVLDILRSGDPLKDFYDEDFIVLQLAKDLKAARKELEKLGGE